MYMWVHAWLLSYIQLFVTLWTVAHQVPLSTGFSRQEYWSGLPFPSLGDLPIPGIKPGYPVLAGGFCTTEPPGKPIYLWMYTHTCIHIIHTYIKLNHFAIHQKLTQHCKLTILQYIFLKKYIFGGLRHWNLGSHLLPQHNLDYPDWCNMIVHLILIKKKS